MKKIILLLLLVPNLLSAQKTLSKYELDNFQKKALEYVGNFQSYVIDLAQKRKQTTIDLAMHLFDPAAKISVSGNNKPYDIYDYLSNVVPGYGKRNSIVVIKFEASKIDNLVQKKDAKGDVYYEGTYSFTQLFGANKKAPLTNNGERPRIDHFDYSDVTHKTGKIIIKKLITIEGAKWIMKLGDISVKDCKVTSGQKH